jgi:hypothetical protein
MGEAKRRRGAVGKVIGTTTDATNGKTYQTRYGGGLGPFLGKLSFDREAAVPCQGCNQCCYHARVDVYPDKERPENLAQLDVVPHADGNGFVLAKRDDGACVHLGSGGECTVYQHRPQACRLYDCRAFSVIGLVDTFNGGRNSPAWVFDTRTADERVMDLALRLAAENYIAGHPQWNANTVLVAAFVGQKDTLARATELVARFEAQPPAVQEEIRRRALERASREHERAAKLTATG